MFGPSTLNSQVLHQAKYRDENETFDDYCIRYARTASDGEDHFRHLLDALRQQRILPAGRQQLAVGRPYDITAVNCFVGETIPDSSEGIFNALKNSMLTLRSGGGCGWNFSTLRPYGDNIRGLGIKAYSTGPVSFMDCWNTMCNTIMSAGHRRGAMMGVLDITHPDIMRFINAKADQKALSNFNLSVAVTDQFMDALRTDSTYDLMFDGRVYDRARAVDVWARIMERNWDWAEPGILFMDRINKMNPLSYCETINSTNPCGEQPLPAYGACLLGSLNLVKYIKELPLHIAEEKQEQYVFDWSLLSLDAATANRAFDNVIDVTTYPLVDQQKEAKSKRRQGLGVTGMANVLAILGHRYGSKEYLDQQDNILKTIRDAAYEASIEAAKFYGSFPLFKADKWLDSGFAYSLPEDIRNRIKKHGLRNGVLLSIAPTGTISLCADNVSPSIEPPYMLNVSRLINMPGEEQIEVNIQDHALEKYGIKTKTADEVSAKDHVNVYCRAQKYIDSAVSKTCNVNGVKAGQKKKRGEVSFDDFKELYLMAYKKGAKGCTTFNINGKKAGIFKKKLEGGACEIDPSTGIRTCEE